MTTLCQRCDNVVKTLRQRCDNVVTTLGQRWDNVGTTLGQRWDNVDVLHYSQHCGNFSGSLQIFVAATLFQNVFAMILQHCHNVVTTLVGNSHTKLTKGVIRSSWNRFEHCSE